MATPFFQRLRLKLQSYLTLLFLFHPMFDPSANLVLAFRINPESACSLHCPGYNLVQTSPPSGLPLSLSPPPWLLPALSSTQSLHWLFPLPRDSLSSPNLMYAWLSLSTPSHLSSGLTFSEIPTITSIFDIATVSLLPSLSCIFSIPLTLLDLFVFSFFFFHNIYHF